MEEHTVLLDLRMRSDFDTWHLPFSQSLHLRSLDAGTANPFEDAATLEKQWLELDALFRPDSERVAELQGKHVLAICYDGDTSRVATSVLRSKGVDACNLKGGLRNLAKKWAALALEKSEAAPLSNSNEVPNTDIPGAPTDAPVMPELARTVAV